MIYPSVKNETSRLRTLVLGCAKDFGGTPGLADVYDPKSAEHVKLGSFPTQEAVLHEMDQLEAVFDKYDVVLYRPENLVGVNQLFARDIGFVIDNTFVVPKVIEIRNKEARGINKFIELLNPESVIRVEGDARVEGGDVMPWNEELFIGYSEEEDFNTFKVSRTNKAGVDFLINNFHHKNIHSFELNKSDEVAMDNALHLDCCFQPIGTNQAIIYKGGFKNEEDIAFLINYFGEDNLIEISQQEMYEMNSNIFSISPEVIISCHSFKRLNEELERKGFIVEKIDYEEIAKMEGLLRCSTMPIIRD